MEIIIFEIIIVFYFETWIMNYNTLQRLCTEIKQLLNSQYGERFIVPLTHMYVCITIYIYTHMCVYIYIYREREREICVYVYIYIYM